MEFWTSDETTAPPPPQFWWQQLSPPPQSPSSYRHFTEQPTTQGIVRALEKEKIREEIMASEMARMRELEAEVMEELRTVREMASRMKRGSVFDRLRFPMESRGESLMPEAVDKLAMSFEQSLRIRRTENIFLAKAKRNGRKRKLESVPELSGIGKKRGKETWICDLCQVCANSKVSLNDHLGGKKHASKMKGILPKTASEATPKKPKASKQRMRKFSSAAKGRKMKGEGRRLQ